jgi:hypothetical protein
MVNPEEFLVQKAPLLRWLTRRCFRPGFPVVDVDDVRQEVYCRALSVARRYAALPEIDLARVIVQSVLRRGADMYGREYRRRATEVLFDVDLRELVDPRGAVALMEIEARAEAERLLSGLPLAVACELLAPSPTLIGRVREALSRAPRRPRYVTIADVADYLGVTRRSAYGAFTDAVTALAAVA